MSTVKLFFFGSFRAQIQGELLSSLPTAKDAALLAYLALEGQTPQHRSHLERLFWGDYPVSSARLSLRVALSHLRQALAPFPLLHTTHKVVQWYDPQGISWCDALLLKKLALTAPKQRSPEQVEEILALYTGEFLTGWEWLDLGLFTEWLRKQRQYYQDLVANLKQQHAQHALRPLSHVRRITPRHNLQPPMTPIFGRTQEIEQLCQLLLTSHQPLITLVGEGGIGKTRLALAAAHQIVEQGLPAAEPGAISTPSFMDGIWFVSLTEIAPTTEPEETVAAAIGQVLGVNFSTKGTLAQQLTAYLQHKSLLLILDNFEHLVLSSPLLKSMLEVAINVKIVVTSRHRLLLQAAVLFPVHPLAIPDSTIAQSAPTDEVSRYPSIQIFVARAQRSYALFQLHSHNQGDVARICQLVGGNPLGIELAAAMTEVCACHEIVDQLTNHRLDLTADWADLPVRQRSMSRVLSFSWELLTVQEAQLLMRCAVFQGPFTSKAALAIGQASFPTLHALIHKSLLCQVDTSEEHLTMHELVRQYAFQQLHRLPDSAAHLAETESRSRHARYYLGLLQVHATDLPNDIGAQQQIFAEFDNIRAAWKWSVAQGEMALLEQGLDGLVWFYRVAAFYQEAYTVFQQGADYVRHYTIIEGSKVKRRCALLARFLIHAVEFGRHVSHAEQNERLLQEAGHLVEESGDPQLQALLHYELAWLAHLRGDTTAMHTHATAAMHWARQQTAPEIELFCANTLAAAHIARGDYSNGIKHYEAVEQMLARSPNRYLEAIVAGNLGFTYYQRKMYMAALHHGQRALQCERTFNQPHSGYTLVLMGDLWVEFGMWEQAQAMYGQALTFFQDNHDTLWLAVARRGLGCLAVMTGDYATAHHHLQEALQSIQKQQIGLIEADFLIWLSRIQAGLSIIEAVATNYQRVINLSTETDTFTYLGDAYAGLAAFELSQGRQAAAREAAELLLTRFARHGLQAAQKPFLAYWQCYQVLQALDDDRAPALLQRAYTDLMQIAAQISVPELYTSFLENVPSNRAIVTAIRQTTTKK